MHFRISGNFNKTRSFKKNLKTKNKAILKGGEKMRHDTIDNKFSKLNQFTDHKALLKILEIIGNLKVELSANGDVGVPYVLDYLIKCPSRVDFVFFPEIKIGDWYNFRWLAIVCYLLNYDLFKSGNAQWCRGDELDTPLIGEIKRWWGKVSDMLPAEVEITNEMVEAYCSKFDLPGAEEIFKHEIGI